MSKRPRTITEKIRRAIKRDVDRGKREQQQIAEAAGVSNATVSQFLKGKRVRSEVLDKLAAAMDLDITKRRRRGEVAEA